MTKLSRMTETLKSEWETHPTRLAARGLLLLSVSIGVMGYLKLHGLQFQNIINDFYANVSAELASIALTVLIIDHLNERRAAALSSEQRARRIIRELTSNVDDVRNKAIEDAKHTGILYDGSMVNASLNWVDFTTQDLTSAILNDTHMSGAKFKDAILFEAKLINTSLNEANLEGAKLIRADLTNAYLRNASLVSADMSGAILVDADLTGANLSEANLTGAILYNANLCGANLTRAILSKEFLKDSVVYDVHTLWPDAASGTPKTKS